MEKIKLYSDRVWISEQTQDPEILTLRILISTFEPNLNGVLINRATIDSWLDSILTKPLVAKIAYKTDKSGKNQIADFTGHNVSIETYIDENGAEQERVLFDTQAFGTIVSAAIEDIDGKEGIVVVAHVWRRYYTATEIIERRIKEGNLHTSWEISVLDYEKKIIGGQLVKVINNGIFSADTMLGTAYPPAFPTARILDVASEENDTELCDALIQDTMSLNNENSQGNEVQAMNENEIVIENAEEKPAYPPVVEQAEETPHAEEHPAEPTAEEKPAVAELTMWDLRKKVEIAICNKLDVNWLDMIWLFPVAAKAWAHKYEDDEMNLSEFAYTVENDEVTVSEPVLVTLTVSPREANAAISTRDATIVTLNSQIQELSATVESLSPFKAAFEKAEADRLKAEHEAAEATLRQYIEDSGMFTDKEIESAEITALISELKTSEIDALISKRVVAKNAKPRKPETASTKTQPKPKADINISEEKSNPGKVLMDWLNK
jgi:hypothetical protein